VVQQVRALATPGASASGRFDDLADGRRPNQPEHAVPEMNSIPLDQTQVRLIAAVLQREAASCGAVHYPAHPGSAPSGVTLGRMAARWTGIAEREEDCAVVNVDGERLYDITDVPEGWYIVRAALSEHAARLSRTPQGSATSGEDRRQALRALRLVERIARATRG
jgi:hypothetical protein